MAKLGVSVGIGFLLGVVGVGVRADPTPDQILQESGIIFNGLNDCTSLVRATVQAEDVQLPPTKLRFYYKRPHRAKLEVLEGGLFLMPKGESLPVLLGFGDATFSLRRNSRAEFVKTGPLNHRTHHVLKLIPQRADHPIRCYYIWFDAQRYTISQLRLYPREGGEWLIRVQHTRVARRFWLPLRAEIRVTAEGTPPATLTFSFSDYRINSGLPDALFREKS